MTYFSSLNVIRAMRGVGAFDTMVDTLTHAVSLARLISQSMTYFTSLNKIRAMRAVGASDTVMAP